MARLNPISDTSESPGRIERRRAQAAQRQIDRQITDRLPVVRPRGPIGLARRLLANYFRDDGDGLATIIAYSALFSILPILFVMYAILSLLVHSDVIYDQIQNLISALFPEQSASSVMSVVQRGRSNTSEIGMVALVSFIFGGSRLFGALDRTLATINRVPRRPWIKRKLISLVMVPLMAVLMILGAVVTTFATVLLTFPERYLNTENPGWYPGAVVLLLSLTIGFFASLVLYTVVPVSRPHWRSVWKGSFVAGLLFVLLSQLFPLYLRLTGGFSLFGSAFAFVFILLLWFYLLGQIIVVGAEVNSLAKHDPPATEPHLVAEPLGETGPHDDVHAIPAPHATSGEP